jgi:hypothetical protein
MEREEKFKLLGGRQPSTDSKADENHNIYAMLPSRALIIRRQLGPGCGCCDFVLVL